jgi:hypothetical protein
VAVTVLAEIWRLEKNKKMKKKWQLVVTIDSGSGSIGWGVAVVGWQWYRWIEEVGAVRMVPIRTWQWQY